MNNIDISELPKYKRQPCINCDYKLICAGECEKTINKTMLSIKERSSNGD